jgi:hypothetical protein
MLTEEEFVEASALHRRGWSVSAIARHLGRDRKTIRAYLRGERTPGVRRRAVADHFAVFAPYVRERLAEDPHLWGSTLYDEVLVTCSPPVLTPQAAVFCRSSQVSRTSSGVR